MEGNNSMIEMRGIVKRFGGLVANDHVDLEIRPGEVLGLLGENGAGKTTLMRVLYGIYQLDEGEIWVSGKRVQIRAPHDAIAAGIGMIHQKLLLVLTMTVTQNVILGTEPVKRGLVDMKWAVDAVAALAEKYGIRVDVTAKVGKLSLGEQQCTEILKALYRKAEVLILDEPTSILTPAQTRELFATLRGMASRGEKVVFITHKLPEVFEVTDRVVVLRDGKVVGAFRTNETNERELAMAMVGRELREVISYGDCIGGAVLRLEDVSTLEEQGSVALKEVCLSACSGEILGIGGVSGNGQRELVEVIAGLKTVSAGKVIIDDREVTKGDPRLAQSLGVCFIPADRYEMGTIGQFTVAENLVLQQHDQEPFSSRGFLAHGQIRSFAENLVNVYDVHCQGVTAQARTLSGGNLQKLVLARELTKKPNVLVAEYPTRGLDIAATEYVHRTLREQRSRGAAVIAVCSDLDELLELSDRVVIMYEGHVQGELRRQEFDIERIGLMMTGMASNARTGREQS